MRKGRKTAVLLGFLWATLLMLLYACGEIGGSGQCGGVEDSGVCVTVVSIEPFDETTDTADVDAFAAEDCDGDLLTLDPEPLFKHSATVTLSADLIPILTAPPAPEFVTFTSYTIDYIPSDANLIFAPALTTQVFGTTIRVDIDSTTPTDLELVPIQTKLQYVDLGGDPRVSIYSVIYTFEGTTQFNKGVVLQGSTTVNIGDFNNC